MRGCFVNRTDLLLRNWISKVNETLARKNTRTVTGPYGIMIEALKCLGNWMGLVNYILQ